MPTHDFRIYILDPWTMFSRSTGGLTTYSGPDDPQGDVTLTDNGAGIDGQTLEDNSSGETATADVLIGGVQATGVPVSAEESWTLLDTVTGQTFEIVTFHVESGPNAGYFTLSEIDLVAGRVYRTLDFDNSPNAGAGDPVFTYADYDFPEPDGVVEGTAGDDVIDADYTGDPDGDMVDAGDAPGAAGPTPLHLAWTTYSDEFDLSAGLTQDTGGIVVDVTYGGPAGGEFSAEHSGQYRAAGEPFNQNSGAYIYQNGSAVDATVDFDFSAAAGSGYEDEVRNVSFRINDVDGVINSANNFRDILTVTAYDANGNPVPVTLTATGDDTVSGQTVTAAITNNSETQAAGSVRVDIAGPVARIEIVYDNGGDTQQAIFLTDLHFDAVPLGLDDDLILAGDGNDIVDAGRGDDQVFGEDGNDTLTGGAGADMLDGGAGDDILNVGSGDTAFGGDGDDTFVIDAGALGGGTISITGGETGETAGDTLDFAGQLLAGSVVITNADDAAGGKSGTATLVDGTTVSFSEIEHIICFVSGTGIETPHGPRAIEDIRPGDLVLSADRGPVPVRWCGKRTVPGTGAGAPVRIAKGFLGNHRPLFVSPQHRMLISDHRAQIYFGGEAVLVPAKALIDGIDVDEAEVAQVTYHHVMLDRHEIIIAEGARTESYHPGAYSLDGLEPASREALFATFPALRADPSCYGPMARQSLRPSAARILVA